MSPPKKNKGFTPAKGALVALLVVVFVVVWAPQLVSLGEGRGAGAESARRERPPRPAQQRTPRGAEVASAGDEVAARNARQPIEIDLDRALAHDPFEPPAWSPEAARRAQLARSTPETPDQIEARAQALRESGVAMVLVSEKGRAASINGQTIRVGDELDGFRVIEINATGIVVEPTPNTGRGGSGGDDEE